MPQPGGANGSTRKPGTAIYEDLGRLMAPNLGQWHAMLHAQSLATQLGPAVESGFATIPNELAAESSERCANVQVNALNTYFAGRLAFKVETRGDQHVILVSKSTPEDAKKAALDAHAKQVALGLIDNPRSVAVTQWQIEPGGESLAFHVVAVAEQAKTLSSYPGVIHGFVNSRGTICMWIEPRAGYSYSFDVEKEAGHITNSL